MSLCPSSSHQLVAASIAFQRARHKFPKDFGLQNVPKNAEAAATNREGIINQAKSSYTLLKHACNSRSEHVCPASMSLRCRNHCRNSCSRENSLLISCSYCRGHGEVAETKNSANISQLRNESTRDEDAIDMLPTRECEDFATSGTDKNEYIKQAERYDTAWRTMDDKPVKMTECHQQSGCRTFSHHLKAHCPSKLCANSNSVDQLHDVSCTKDEVARGDFLVHKSKEILWTNCHETSIDRDRRVEEDTCLDVTTRNTRNQDPEIEDVWTKSDTLTPRREIDSVHWRCQCKLYARRQFNLDLSRSSCNRYCDKCHYHRDYNHDYFHQNRYCQEHHTARNASNTKGCATHGCIVNRKAQYKGCHCDSMLDENSRLCERYCCKKSSTIASGIRERNNEEHEEDDDEVPVINHKDSMCILAEKYKANRRYCDGNKIEARMEDRTGKDECNKSLTSEIIDQPDPLESVNVVPHEGSSMKHICHAHCMSCGTTIEKTCSRGRRYATSEDEFQQFKSPLKETTAHCCSKRTSCKCNF